MSKFSLFKSKTPDNSKATNTKDYADSSSIPDGEREFYQPDEYYTFYTNKDTPFEQKVIEFEARKRISYPSERGLYVGEILLLLEYCSYGTYPNPKSGYPGFWWFKYGIRDVGTVLKSLEQRGYIRQSNTDESISKLTMTELKAILQSIGMDIKGKKDELQSRICKSVSDDCLNKYAIRRYYVLTPLGAQELHDNEYVPYMHKNGKTIEGSKFGPPFEIWDINLTLGRGSKNGWRQVVERKQQAFEEYINRK